MIDTDSPTASTARHHHSAAIRDETSAATHRATRNQLVRKLHDDEGFSYVAIAEYLSVSEGAVRRMVR